MSEAVDVVVVGAGVVGLAIAAALAEAGRGVLILEGEPIFGSGTSSRNSEVIHAGIYYPTGSLKHRTCLRGKELLYAFCAEAGVPHRRCGKLIVAADEAQQPGLAALAAQAEANDVAVELLDGPAARAMEPALRVSAALLSPSSGIVDSHAYMLALLGRAEAHGALLACRTEVRRIARHDDRWRLWIAGEEAPAVEARWVINAAGLGAQAVSRTIEGIAADAVPPLFLAKGNYCAYGGRVPFGRLIYPLPEPGGLGVHLTIDLAGQGKFGPNVQWIEAIDYATDELDTRPFAAAIRHWWPGVDPAKLAPGYAGVRPKLSGPGAANEDFRIDGPGAHGLPNVIALYGIESPGLTASLALAEMVAGIARTEET